jgi:polysaccharide deacetylase family protein (PEP-CTERM system associated)
MINALTIDVEDYHNVIARDWLGKDGPPTDAVVKNTRRFLQHFADHNVCGTFFILGEVAKTFPELVREVAAAGHELGVHGFKHRQVFKLTPDEFRREVSDAKALIEDVAGVGANGHRAPAFSIVPDTKWALDVLADVGFTYDSSVFPIAGKRYGWPGFPLDIHKVELDQGRSIIEVPMSTVGILGKRLPACGGGYLRHFPWFVTRWAMKRVQRQRPAIVYMHPYEIEVDCGPLDTSSLDNKAAQRTKRFHRLQLRNRHTTERKLLRLLTSFTFAPLGRVIHDTITSHDSCGSAT